MSYHGSNGVCNEGKQDAFGAIEARTKANTALILEKSEKEKILPRQAAVRNRQRESFKGDEIQGILTAVVKREALLQ